MDWPPHIVDFGIAVLLGLLVGMEREHSKDHKAGVRTFPIATLLGAIAAVVGSELGGWLPAAGLIALTAIVGGSAYLRASFGEDEPHLGITTEVALLAMYCVGAYVIVGSRVTAVVAGVVVAVLLHLKPRLHSLIGRMQEKDLRAIMQFAVVTFLILPVLPRETYGPYDVFNPFETWLMVVLIVGISLVGYVLYKVAGQRIGTLLGAAVGGLVSSTATTVSFSRRARSDSVAAAWSIAIAIVIASSIVFGRVLIEVLVVSRTFFWQAVYPLAGYLLASLAVAGIAWWLTRSETEAELDEPRNPTELRSALIFAGLYVLVKFAVTIVKERLDDSWLYVVAIVSGLTDMDAITLSTAHLVERGTIDTDTGWRLLVVGAMANIVFKYGIAVFLGGRHLRKVLGILFGILLAIGGAILGVGVLF